MDFFGKEGFVWWKGVCEDRKDPLKLGRYKIRIFGFHKADKAAMPTAGLPWAHPSLPMDNGKNVVGMKEGDFCWGFFRDGEEAQEPIVVGYFPGIPEREADPSTGFYDPTPDEELTPDLQPRPPEYSPVQDTTTDGNASGGAFSDPNVLPGQNIAFGELAADFDPANYKWDVNNDGTYNAQDAKIIIGGNGSGQDGVIPSEQAGAAAASSLDMSRYPLREQLKEPTSSRLARNENIDQTIIGKKRGSVVSAESASHIAIGVGSDAANETEPFSEPATAYDAVYPFNHVYESESGHVSEVDDTPGKERLHRYHRSGTFEEIHPNGTRVVKGVKRGYNIYLEDFYLSAGADAALTAKNDFLIKAGQIMNLDSGSDMNLDSGANRNEHVGKDNNVKISGNKYVVIDGDCRVLIKGNSFLSVEGNLETAVKGDYLLDVKGNVRIASGGLMEVKSDTQLSLEGTAIATQALITCINGPAGGPEFVAGFATIAEDISSIPTSAALPVIPVPTVNEADNKDNIETSSSPKEGFILYGTFGDLYKPKSDSSGKLVTLSPVLGAPHYLFEALPTGELEDTRIQYKHTDNSITTWNVVRPIHKKGAFIEKGVFSGNGNGGRDHYRYSKSGSEYPIQMYWCIGNTCYLILNSAIRHEAFGGSVPDVVVAQPEAPVFALPGVVIEEPPVEVSPPTLPPAPSISATPLSQSVSAGQTATFNVAASGAGPISYRWRKNGVPINGATNSSYTTPILTQNDTGSVYSVVVTNSGGSTTSLDAILTVQFVAPPPPAPTITVQPSNQTVTAGQTATFTVAASGSGQLSYQWRKNGTPIVNAVLSSYTTPITAVVDTGTLYSVAVTNTGGTTVSNNATLFVQSAVPPAPTITTHPANQTVFSGQTATFSVSASGTAPLSYQWRKNGINVSGATAFNYTTPVTVVGDSGTLYSVVVTNAGGSATSNNATLTVQAAPSFTFNYTPDVTTIITNPGIGIQSTQNFPNTLNNPRNYPVRNMTFRFAHSEIEPSQGSYQFDKLDDVMSRARAQLTKVNLRFIYGEPDAGVPSWVTAIAGYTAQCDDNGRTSNDNYPDWSNVNVKAAFTNLHAAYSGRYKAHPALGYFDANSIGLYGEGHWSATYIQTKTGGAPGTIGAAIPMIGSQDIFDHLDTIKLAWGDKVYYIPACTDDPNIWAQSRLLGMGARGDGWGYRSSSGATTGSGIGVQMFSIYPSTFEAQNPYQINPLSLETYSNFATWVSSGWNYNASLQYAVNQHVCLYNIKNNSNHSSVMNAGMDNLLRNGGFKLALTQVSYLQQVTAGNTLQISTVWNNTGNSPMYFNYTIGVKFTNTTTGLYFVVDTTISPKYLPGSNISQSLSVAIPAYAPAGTYTVRIGVIDPLLNLPEVQLNNNASDYDGQWWVGGAANTITINNSLSLPAPVVDFASSFNSTGSQFLGSSTSMRRQFRQDPWSRNTNGCSSSGTTFTGVALLSGFHLRVGDTITFGGQTKTIASIAGETTLTTDTAFSPVVATGNTISYNLYSDFTMMFKARLGDKSATHVLISKGNVGTTAQEYSVYYDQPTDRFIFRVCNGSTIFTVTANSLGSPTVGTTYTILVSYNHPTKQMRIRIDNGTSDTGTATGVITVGTNEFRIGADTSGRYHQGTIMQYYYWRRLLTSGEETSMYNGGALKRYDQLDQTERMHLYANFPLNEASGSRLDKHNALVLTNNGGVTQTAAI